MRKIIPAPPTEIRYCTVCQKSFTCRPNEWPNNFRRRLTCGIKCGHVIISQKRTYLKPKICANCRKEFKPREQKDKFCSQKCYGLFKTGKPTTYSPPRFPRTIGYCLTCKKEFLYLSKKIKKFCSRECYQKFLQYHPLGKNFHYNGQNDFYLSTEWSKIKKNIKIRNQYTCQVCNRAFKPKSPGMIIHHIKSRELFANINKYRHPEADNENNLITACRSCHEKIHIGCLSLLLARRA